MKLIVLFIIILIIIVFISFFKKSKNANRQKNVNSDKIIDLEIDPETKEYKPKD